MRDVDLERTRRVPKGSSVYLRGWTLLESPLRIPRAARVTFGNSVREVRLDRLRSDVAESHGEPSLAVCGFALVSSLDALLLGEHDLVLEALDGDGSAYEVARHGFEIVSSRAYVAGKLPVTDEHVAISIDLVHTRHGMTAIDGSVIEATVGETIVIHGWAIDRDARRGASAVYCVVDDEQYAVGNHAVPREDVARALAMPAARRCGFSIRVPTSHLSPGSHTLAVCALSTDGRSYNVAVVGDVLLAR